MWHDKKFAFGRQSFTGCLWVALLLGQLNTLAFGQIVCRGAYGADCNRRFDQNSYLGSHNSFANDDDGWGTPNQTQSMTVQLNQGVRFLNIDVWLMEQYEERGFWQERSYTDCNAVPMPIPSHYEVTMAHDVNKFGHTPYQNARFRPFVNGLREIRNWLVAHPEAVVSLELENKVPACPRAQALVQQAFTDSGLSNLLFYLDQANTGMPVPGRPAGEWWDVTKHGFPTLLQMVTSNKRLALLPDDLTKAPDKKYSYHVETVYGTDSLSLFAWWHNRDESSAIDDFTRPLFVMPHFPGAPGIRPILVFPYNERYIWLDNKLEDLVTRFHRLPTHPQFDFYTHDLLHPVGNSNPNPYAESEWTKPLYWLYDLNQAWKNLPLNVTAAHSVTPAPNQYGWNNSEVTVNLLWHFPIHTVVSSVFATGYNALGSAAKQGEHSYTIVDEGKTTVSYAAIGNVEPPDFKNAYARGPQRFVDVKIDREPPLINVAGNAQSYAVDQDVNIALSATDYLSGMLALSPLHITGPAYQFNIGDNSIAVTASDKAGNQSSRTVSFRVQVTAASLGNLTRRSVTNQGIANSLQAKLDAAQRALERGDLAQQAQHIETYINELQNHIGRFITAEQAAILIRLARAW